MRRATALLGPLVGLLGLAGLLGAPGALAAQEPDPFTLDLERSGQAALARDDHALAARKLRLACFGLLDHPKRLAGCLVRLGLAQGRAADKAGFAATFERIDAVEDRFQAYAGANLSAEERREFEDRLAQWVPPASLARRQAFAPLAHRLALRGAEGDLEAGRAAEALLRLEGVPVEVEQGRAWCLRGEAHARLDHCREAAAAFAACRPEGEARFAAPALACYAELGRTAEAKRLISLLPEAVRAEPQVRRRLSAFD
jgi:hypothetical protein